LKRPKLEILESDDIRKIIAAAYDLLENFGVMVDNEEALGILEDGGARVDVKEKVAYIPGAMVDKALETRPSGFAIYDQEGKKPAVLENDNIH
jgi:trimethylamine:corrinoid methyltransferase-like protein